MDQIADKSVVGTDFAAEAFLARLGERGIDYVFANAGTDFAPIIEAVSRNSGGRKYPRFITVPHENVAMAMANGYYRVAGKPAAVMLHVTVGTANAVCQLMNMARDNVPVLLCAGRTPVTETGHIASRNGAIHWGQESFDQGGMVREFVKWDYELRAGQPVGALVDRALDIAMSEPRGPVYLCLPREVLADDAVPMRRDNVRPLGVVPAAPSLKVIEEAAQLIAKAELSADHHVGAGPFGRSGGGAGRLSSAQAIPVLQINATDMNLPSDHAMNLGYGPDPNPHLAQADLVIVINSGVPWMPRMAKPKASTKVIHIGVDPLVSRHPFREYEADLLVAGDPVAAVTMLNQALGAGDKGKLDARRKTVAAAREEMRAAREKMLAQARTRCRSIRPGSRIASTRRRRRMRSSSTSSASRPAGSTSEPAQLHRHVARRRPRRRSRHGARRQTRRARSRSDRRGRRRLLHVRQSVTPARPTRSDDSPCCSSSARPRPGPVVRTRLGRRRARRRPRSRA